MVANAPITTAAAMPASNAVPPSACWAIWRHTHARGIIIARTARAINRPWIKYLTLEPGACARLPRPPAPSEDM